ncbi:MAG: replicative DNA helicase [Trueperaceae bacterium]
MPTVDRLPPQNLEAEQSVLGSILLDNEVFAAIEGTLVAEQFYKESHRKIFRIFEKLARRGEPIDLVTVTEELRQTGELESIGSVPYLIGLADSVPTAAYAENYAKIVSEKAVLRDLIGASGQIMQTAYDQAMPLEQILDKAESSIFELATNKRTHSFQGMGGLMTETFAQINELFNNPDPITGLRMGFKELDTMTAGLQPSSLNVLAARPSMGKTALALTIGQNAALRDGKTIGVFSLEMSAVQLVTRMLCSEARVDMSRVRNGQLSERDFQRLADTAGRMSEAKVFIDDNADMSVMELRSRARRLMAEHGLGLVIIDYLQLMSGSNKSAGGGENRQQEISAISRGLKALARELDVPVLVLSQLSRAVESRPNKRPMLSDLRECVTGDTLVALRDGRRIAIQDLVGTTPCVYAMTPEGKLTCAKSDKVWQVGKKEVFEVTLESGRTIKATAKHQLFSARGWHRVSDLRVGDFLGVSRFMPEPADPVVWSDHEVILLGHLIGDGSYLNHQPLRYTTISEENSKAVEESAQMMGSTVKRYAGRGNWHQLLIAGNGNRWHPKGVGKWLKDLGIYNQRSHEKRIPEAAFRLGNSQTALLLRHLWATDGCIHVRKGKGSNALYYSTTSKILANDVAALLLRFGIVARLRIVTQGQYKPNYHVSITGLEQQQIFLNVIGAFGPRKQHADQLVKTLKSKQGNTNVDVIPKAIFDRIRELMKVKGISTRDMAVLRGTAYGGSSHFRFSPSRKMLREYAEILEDKILHQLATSDLFWDKIKSITLVGEENVYDLTVPGPSSWLADSIVSHNSGAIEQDADLVMFIYRDEYYDQQSEKQGIAEVIIGKQRNGPVGTVELQFHNAHVRFNDLAKPT